MKTYYSIKIQGSTRDGLSNNQKRCVRDKASRYVVEQQCLYALKRTRMEEAERGSYCEAGRKGPNFELVSWRYRWDSLWKGQDM